MELKIRKNGDVYIIDVTGEMDLYNSYKLKELVMKMLEKNVKNFVINLEQVDYIDSSGIGALIYICSTIKKMNLNQFIMFLKKERMYHSIIHRLLNCYIY